MFKEVPIARSLRFAFGGGIAGLMLSASPVHAQDAAAPVQKGERVEVTGSSIKRIDAEGALPVTVIRREDIDRLGVVSTAELLDRIAANNGGGFAASLGTGGVGERQGFAAASIHGLGSVNTLILLNGRRMAVYGFDGGATSLNNIPLAALERVEVLRDGASAVYGSDAIGGVLNFITRKDFTGAVVDTAYYSTDSKGGNYGNATATVGYGDLASQGFNFFGSVDYRKQGSIAANERTYSGSAYRPDLGINRLSGQAIPADVGTSAGNLSPYAPACLPPVSFSLAATPKTCRFDYASVIDIYSPTEAASIFLRGTIQLGANNQLFIEGNHSETRQKFVSSPPPISSATTFNGDPVLYARTGPYYPGNGIVPALTTAAGVPVAADSGGYPGYASLFWRGLAAGPRTDVSKDKFDRVLLGLEGSGFGWDYNIGALHTRDRTNDIYVAGYISESALLRVTNGLKPTDGAPYSAAVLAAGGINPNINPFSVNQTAAGSAAISAAQILGSVRKSDSKRDSVDGHASRELFNLPAGPLTVAIGGEGRLERYSDNPAPVFSQGDIIGGSGNQPPVNGQRHVYATFFELNAPVVKDLEIGLAARFDHYEDFGSTTNPKGTIRWQPAREILLRGSIGKGFRAPTLPELFSAQSQSNTGNAYDDPFYDSSNGGNRCVTQFTANYCNAQLKTILGGNPVLQPEKSYQYSAGFLLEPTRDISFGADYFYVKQKQLIGAVDQDVSLQDFIDNFNPVTRTSSSVYASNVSTRFDPIFGTTVINAVSGLNQNLGVQSTKGIDFTLKARAPMGAYGSLTFNADGSYLISQKLKLIGQPDYAENVGKFATLGPVQRFKHVDSLTYEYGPYTGAVVYNWGSGYQDYSGNRTVGANESWDVLASYTGIKGLRATLGVKNLLDRNPPISDQGAYFQVGYDPTVGDPHGRTYYARLTYTYK